MCLLRFPSCCEWCDVIPADLLLPMLACWLLTVAIETAILIIGLSPRHPTSMKLFAGLWLTSCTFPIVWLVLPPRFSDRMCYLLFAESFAPVVECLPFWLAFLKGQPVDRLGLRDLLAIVAANLASFLAGELIL